MDRDLDSLVIAPPTPCNGPLGRGREPALLPCAALALLLVLASPLAAAAQPVQYQALFLTGDAAPGGPPGAVLDELEQTGLPVPLQNAAQEIAFFGLLAQGIGGITAADDEVLWGPSGPGGLAPLLREGTQAPGFGPGLVLSSTAFGPALNDAGQVLVDWRLRLGSGGVTSANDQVKWLSDGQGAVAAVARTGDVAPGTFDVFESLSIGVLSDTGRVAFEGVLDSVPSSDEGLFATNELGALELLVREGNPAPDPDTATMGSIVAPVIGGQGHIAFRGFLASGPGVTLDNNGCLWRSDGAGEFSLIAREGDAVPGAPSETYLGFASPFLNDSGQAAVRASLVSGGIAIMGPDGVGGLTALATIGGPAPGVPGALFLFLNNLALNDAGEVAYRGSMQSGPGGVTTADDAGVWGPDGNGGSELRIREGDSFPGPMGALVLDSISTDPTMNAAGDLAVIGRLRFGVGGVNGTNRDVLLLSRPGGQTTIMARTGDAIEVRPGDVRTLSDFATCCNPGEGSGRFLFAASFADGSSGVISAGLVSSVPVLPARALFGLVAAVLAAAALRALVVAWRGTATG